MTSITEDFLEENFIIHLIKNNGPIFQSAVLWSKDKRFVIDTRSSEMLDKKNKKCYSLTKESANMIFLACRYAFDACY